MTVRTSFECYCKRCRRGWGWSEKQAQYIAVAKIHYTDLKDIGELTACGKRLNDVTGFVLPFWPEVTCRACLNNRPVVDRFTLYPKP